MPYAGIAAPTGSCILWWHRRIAVVGTPAGYNFFSAAGRHDLKASCNGIPVASPMGAGGTHFVYSRITAHKDSPFQMIAPTAVLV